MIFSGKVNPSKWRSRSESEFYKGVKSEESDAKLSDLPMSRVKCR